MAQDSFPFSERLNLLLGPEEGRAVFREIMRELYPELPGAAASGQMPEDGRMGELEQIISGIEAGRPLQYLLGKAHFMGLVITVNPSVLIPRPDRKSVV